ncbi:MAG: SsrA-binding protein SmpB [Clostridiales bacterium]|jgi:SsrA-binding protein|nr:SsrA-binding protein SmpB [Clostridiales bacterium]
MILKKTRSVIKYLRNNLAKFTENGWIQVLRPDAENINGGDQLSKKDNIKRIASNRKAFHDYFVLDRIEAGIELFGTEVKSLRNGSVNLKDSFCIIKDDEVFARGVHISPYEKGNIFNRDPKRPKRLLLHKREIRRLKSRIMEDGLTLIPLSLYFKDSRAKLELGVCKGKKLHDKRESEAENRIRRELERTIKENNYR